MTFTCTATAVPGQNFTWIKLDRTERIVDGGQYSIISSTGSSKLILKGVVAVDHGYYACDASMNSEQPNKAIVLKRWLTPVSRVCHAFQSISMCLIDLYHPTFSAHA